MFAATVSNLHDKITPFASTVTTAALISNFAVCPVLPVISVMIAKPVLISP